MGEKIGKNLKEGDIVALYGELGTGKTVLVKGIAKGIECENQVKSPSFVFVHEYKGKIPIYHIDLYRINNPQELLNLGIQEFFEGDGICLIEWAEKAEQTLPLSHIDIKFKVLNKNTREITLSNANFRN
ncbi:tRNA (adenosine(37)-N6)-threonylcarbamoyltransferase complex ATPase subunit type 1 TsaE [candidate division WOR-3 bacterium]|nr:tRNA (adenosine(37)-N6)-threonylcarbamoyltransferase complex ATPase subunit type 1 TsaE [candidate division WOR-3 bacterium]